MMVYLNYFNDCTFKLAKVKFGEKLKKLHTIFIWPELADVLALMYGHWIYSAINIIASL